MIAAANLTQQRLLAVQTNIRGYLISGNEDLLQDYREARAGFPDATLDLQPSSSTDDPGAGAGAPRLIRAEALSYVNNYAERGHRAHARGRGERGAGVRERRRRHGAGGRRRGP